MDRRVKERLIGASILVALVVLVVPELLSGPKPSTASVPTLPAGAPDPIRHVNVDLATSRPTANAEAEPTVAEPPASSAASVVGNSPAPDSSATASATPSSATSPAPAVSAHLGAARTSTAAAKTPATKLAAARPTAVESTAHSPISPSRGSWSVQLGSFASRANADNLTRQLKGQGFSVFVLSGGSGAAVRYRVRAGPLPDRESAERMAAKLKTLGHAGSLVAPTA